MTGRGPPPAPVPDQGLWLATPVGLDAFDVLYRPGR